VGFHCQPEVATGRLDAIAALVELEEKTAGHRLTTVHETLPRIHEDILAELDTKEGGNHVKRNKAEAKYAYNSEEYLDGCGTGSGGPRLKKCTPLIMC
jgi:hypothetical protein